MAKWYDRMIGRIRDAATPDEARKIADEYIDPATGEMRREGMEPDDGDQHIHVHLEGRKPGGNGMDQDPDEMAGGDPVTALEARVAALEEIVQKLASNEEEEVELEGQNEDGTADARRYVMRRGGKMRAKDQDIPVPEREPEIVGTTDLPGIEDLDKRMPTATGDQRRRARAQYLKTHDSADQEDLWKETMAATEILVPGMRLPTFDARLPMGRTAERLCGHRRQVLDRAMKDAATLETIAEVVGIRTSDELKRLSCDSVKMAFTASAAALRTKNNDNGTRRSAGDGATLQTEGKVPTISEIQKRNREFWNAQNGNGAVRR